MNLKLIFTIVIVSFANRFIAQVEGEAASFNEGFWTEKPVLSVLSENEKKK